MTVKKMSPQQQRRIGEFASAAAGTLGLSREAAQRVIAAGSDFQDRIKELIEEFVAEKSPSLIHAAKHVPKGCWPEEGRDVAPTLVSVAELESVELQIPQGVGHVIGGIVLEQAIEKWAMLGLSDAAFVLVHQAEISVEMQAYVLVFAGTILCSPDGRRYLAYLYYERVSKEWCLDFRWIEMGFIRSDRITRRKPVGA